ncbi:ricin-type beta-trefoil lectin domain protein [Streptomyces sp. NPDC127038]|uniref:ricin-type beta-trefoil lectin domain protein n=1 Tax=Streptomyces sp. NPDC127038 TaxID=3347114 RepID=UPI00364AE3FA
MSRESRPQDLWTTKALRRSPRWITVLVAVLSAAAALLSVPLTAAPAHAVNGDGTSRFASYNMRGSDNGGRWDSELVELVRRNPVVALQEAGSGPPPPGPQLQNNFERLRLHRTRPYNQPDVVTVTRWPLGSEGRGESRFVYFLQTDPRRITGTSQDTWDGGRVNLATVTDARADEVEVIENPSYDPDPNAPNNRYRARPLLGLRFGNTWYWNIHARGEDVVEHNGRPGLLDELRDFAARPAQRGRSWVLAGDFNRDILNRTDSDARDRTLHLRADETLLRTNRPTYIDGDRPSELDYAITHGLPGGFRATVPRGAGSDHAEVHYARTALPDQGPTPSHTYSAALGTITGNQMQLNPNGTFGVGPADFGSSQTFRQNTTGAGAHTLQAGARGCVSVASAVRRDVSDARIVAGPCDDPRAQWTITDPRPDPQWNEDNGGPQLWRNVAFPTLCLTPSNRQVTATACSADDVSQRWWSSAVGLPKDWPTTADNVRLESAFMGGRLRRSGSVPGTGVYTQPAPPWWWWIYWLAYERKDYGWNIQQIEPSDNLVRFQSLDGDNRCLGVLSERAPSGTDAVLRTCDDARGFDAAGQRWLAETYADGTIRYRNEADHLCLLAPDATHGNVTLASCNDTLAQRWKVETP